MEVSIEGLHDSLPPKCFIGVRIGNVQKQAPYDPKALYRFPEVKRFGKIDIYQRVGMCDVSWGCEDQETHTCKAVGDSGDTFGLQVSMKRLRNGVAKGGEVVEVASAKSTKQAAAAKSARYIQEQSVEVMLTAAMKALLKTMPDDAAEFLSEFISQNYGCQKKTAQLTTQKSSILTQGNFEPYYRSCVLPSSGQAYFSSFHQRFFPKEVQSAGAAKALQAEKAQLEGRCKQLADTAEQLRRQVEQLEQAAVQRQQSEELWKARALRAEAKTAELAPMSNQQAKPWQVHRGDPSGAAVSAVDPQRQWACSPSVSTWASPSPLPRKLRKKGLVEASEGEAKEIDVLRARAAKCLHEASQDGSLRETLLSSNSEQVMENLRLQTLNALKDASITGRLDDLLASVGSEEDEDLKDVKRDVASVKPLDDIREYARSQLVKASADGSLMNMLKKVTNEAEPSCSEPESWLKKPSVGTWVAKATRPSCMR